jgi:hypothetical protein
MDGICRPLGACDCVPMSGCPYLQFECPNGLCTNTIGHCAKFGRCETKAPFTCGGGTCVPDPMQCPESISAASFPEKIWHYKGSSSFPASSEEKLELPL